MGHKIIKENRGVSIGYEDAKSSLDCFIDIYTKEDDFPSPFEDIESAELFATMILKLLEAVYNFNKDVKNNDFE